MGGESHPEHGWARGQGAREAGDGMKTIMKQSDIPFHDLDEDEGGPDEDRREGLMHDMARNDKYLQILQGQFEVLYDRLAPILTPERPTDDQDKPLQAEVPAWSDLRAHARRQQRTIERMTSNLRDCIERIEL